MKTLLATFGTVCFALASWKGYCDRQVTEATHGRDSALRNWQNVRTQPEMGRMVLPDVEAAAREKYFRFRVKLDDAKRHAWWRSGR